MPELKSNSKVATIKAILLLIALVLLDQLSKILIGYFYPDLVVLNAGWIGGSFYQASTLYRVGLSFGYYSALVLLLTFFWKTISEFSLHFKTPIYFLFAGVTGNVIDRVRIGAVIDFIPMGSIYTNFATCDSERNPKMDRTSAVVYCIHAKERPRS